MNTREIRNRILKFRELLARSIAKNEHNRGKYARGKYAQKVVGARAVTMAILKDFDRYFPPNVMEAKEAAEIHPLIEQHCHKAPNCPICNSPMHRRVGKYGEFKGCSKYPDCGGSRNMSNIPTVNNALRFFLTKQMFQAKLLDEQRGDCRFRNLDI